MFKPDLEPLEKLGLTRVQSKIFVANFSIGPATVKQIAFHANVAREEVYRIMPSLRDLGLIQRHVTSPATYETVNFSDAINLLMKRRQKETNEIVQTTKHLFQLLDQQKETKSWIQFENELVLLSNSDIIDLTILRELGNVNYTLDISINWNVIRFKGQLWDKMLIGLLDEGLKIRIITNLPDENNHILPESTIDLMQNPKCESRYLEQAPSCTLSMYDNIRGLVFNSNCVNDLNPPALWTSNTTILCLMKCYFETTWKSAQELSYNELKIH